MRKLLVTLLSVLAITTLFAQSPTSWSYDQKDNGDGTIDLIFKADIEEPWYMYNTDSIKKGPLPASFEFSNISGFEPVGKLRDLGETHEKMDETFGLMVRIFIKNASFVQTIRKTTEAPVKVTGLLSFQTCNGKKCIIDEVDVAINVKGVAVAATENTDSEKSGKSEGILMFLLIAFAAGIGGVFTPCVFPMIPMTVGFFLSGSGNKKDGIMKGIIFGISVTLIYTLLGVLVAIFKSTDATDTLSTHWVPNLLFAALFIIFAISFLGAFEITLPGGLANKADAKADKGGYIASFFVAFAMVIVSFSCTGPFVGSILAAAVTGGLALKPILGMLVFGLAFSLPFVLFSFFPSLMKKMPKSGGWLNVVKVTFAFILLAFSMKYLAAVDIYFGWGILSRTVFISIWIVLATMLGMYFMGKFKTSHDSEIDHVGAGRLVLAIVSFSFAVYLIPGLFGAPLASLSGIIPPSNKSIEVYEEVVPEGSDGTVKYAYSEHKPPYGLNAYYEIEQAIEAGRQTGKPVLLSFKSMTCGVCKQMESTVWSDPGVLEILKSKVILANLYVDDRTELPAKEQVTSTIDGKVKTTLGRKLRDYQLTHFGIASQPYYVLIDHNQNVLAKTGECSIDEYLKFLETGIKAFESKSRPL